MTTRINPAKAMGFHHQDGLPAAWNQAIQFAGKGGKIATMPDIVAARITAGIDTFPWNWYFTTTTAEYFGIGKDGKRIIIVAHGVGPMSTIQGIKKAYSWEYKDTSRSRRGGRISAQEFLDLEAGRFGPVSIVDFESYCNRYEYPFLQRLKLSQALVDPLLRARFGPNTEDYLRLHADHARKWHREQIGRNPKNGYKLPHRISLERRRYQHLIDGADNSDPYLVIAEGASNCSYGDLKRYVRKIEEGYALAHLVSTGGLCNLGHEDGNSLMNDVSCHEWWNGVRFVALPPGADITQGIRKGPDAYKLLRKYWPELFMTISKPERVGFRALVDVGDKWFTQYLKKGERMDGCEPEYLVTNMEKVGEPTLFRTTIGGYHGFFKYGIKEVETIAPVTANAYVLVGDPQIDGKHHTCMVQFYQVKVDNTKRLMRVDDLGHDFAKMMPLHERQGS